MEKKKNPRTRLSVHSLEPRQVFSVLDFVLELHKNEEISMWHGATVMLTGSFNSLICVSSWISSCLHLASSWLPHPTTDSIPTKPTLTTPPTEHTILGLEVSAGLSLGPTASSTAPVTSTWELTLKERYVAMIMNCYIALFKGSSTACSTQARAQLFVTG